MKKRGLSDVVAVTLIILLSIAAVVIVWTFVRSTLEKTGSEITASCVSVNLKPVSCILGTHAVTVENGAGEITIDKVKLVYYNVTTGASVVSDASCGPIQPLQRVGCTPAATIDPAYTQASVAAIVGTKLCGVSTDKVTCS